MGYVLIITAPMKKEKVYKELLIIPGVEEVVSLFSGWDILVKIESDDFNKIAKLVIDRIHKIDGVMETKILRCIKY